MLLPDNAVRSNHYSIIFLPTPEQKQLFKLKQDNETLTKRIEKIESLLKGK